MAAKDHLHPQQMGLFSGDDYTVPSGPKAPAPDGRRLFSPDAGEQIPAFMSPREMRWQGYRLPEADDEHLYDMKEWESVESGIYDSVQDEGVKEPIHAVVDEWGRGLANGHHRFVSQELADDDRLMPVLHYGDYDRALTGGFHQEERSREDSPESPYYN